MGFLHGALVCTAVLGVLCLPALLVLLVAADELVERSWRLARRRCRGYFRHRTERGLARRAGLLRGPLHRLRRSATDPPAPPAEPTGPPIERIAADLRRLGRQRTGVATRSPVWFAAVQRAYDDRLVLACRALDLAEHLRELTGVDQDIERLRVEGLLIGAGFTLGGEVEPRQDRR